MRENLLLGGYVAARRGRDGQGTARALEQVYGLFPVLRERSEQLAGTLSGGEQQMLAMGRALMTDPRLLMMDEPSMGLAPLVVRDIFRAIRGCATRGGRCSSSSRTPAPRCGSPTAATSSRPGKLVLEGEAGFLLERPRGPARLPRQGLPRGLGMME